MLGMRQGFQINNTEGPKLPRFESGRNVRYWPEAAPRSYIEADRIFQKNRLC